MNTDRRMDEKTLIIALRKMLGEDVARAEYDIKQLHGGTLGNVRLVSGFAETPQGAKLPYRIVWKTQKRFERFADPGSWRREYDLYASDLAAHFTDSLRWPECYLAELDGDEHQLWMEYIEGVSGLDLTSDMYERAAYELGRFQGKLYGRQSALRQSITNLSEVDYMRKNYLHYRSWNEVYDYIRGGDCEIPKHICHMLIEIDENEDEVWRRIKNLPVVLCHRDFWVTNIFYSDGKIALIDWDTAGWGYFGEDIASLIADEADVSRMAECYRRCVASYYKGFSEYADAPAVSGNCVYELIVIMFGYRLVESYKFGNEADKKLNLSVLQQIYEMESNNDG